MAQTRTYSRSFGGGEVSPEMFGRIDDVRFQTGAATMRNFVALAQGPAENRAGFALVREVKDSTKKVRLLPFTFSSTQTLVIEMGAGYFRFHTQGATLGPGSPPAYNGATAYTVGDLVSSGGVNYYCIAATTGNAPPNATYWYAMPAGIYEIPNPYAEADLFDICYVQSGDVLTLVHMDYAPRELSRFGATDWTLTTINFGSPVAPPSSISVSPSTGYTLNITGITIASPGVITTASAHPFVVNDSVYIAGIGGMTQFAAGFYVVNSVPASNTLTVKRFDTGIVVNTTGWSAYTTGGTVQFAQKTADITGQYVVTSIAANGLDESSPSISGSAVNNLNVVGAFNTISWPAVPGALRYKVYKYSSGLYGYIGQTDGTSFIDDNIAPDLGNTPPIFDTTFTGGAITSVPVTNGGSGYGSAAPTGITGTFTNIAVTSGGSNYNNPTLTVTDPSGTGASFTVNTSGAAGSRTITSVTINNGGSNYVAPTLYLSNTPILISGVWRIGSGATFNPTLVPYEAPDLSAQVQLAVSDPTGSGAILQPVVAGGIITGVEVLNGGSGYTNPVVTVSVPLGGVNATFGTPTLTAPQYPGAVSYFEQRRVFAATMPQPQSLWMTKTGTESDLSYSLPLKDIDRISFTVAAREASTIMHVVPLQQLLLLTTSSEWRVSPVNSDVITPTTISVRPQSYIGSNNVTPAIVNNALVYCAARGGHVRELGYSWQNSSYVTGDLSLRAAHLFDEYELVDMCYSKAPQPMLWFVSTSGLLLGLTYIPEQQIGAWHKHDTDGVFESCTAVAEGEEDVLYVVVRREINGQSKRFVERMATRQVSAIEDCFFVDCGLTYDGRNTGSGTVTISGGTNWTPAETLTLTSSAGIFQFPATTDVGDIIVVTGSDGTEYSLKILSTSSSTVASVQTDKTVPVALRNVATTDWSFARDSLSGLSHLEGKTVSILADGAVLPRQVVTGGTVTITPPASVVHVGLPYTCDLETLPMTLQIEAFGQGRAKNVNEAWMRVVASGGILVGPNEDALTQVKFRTTEPYGSPPSLKTEEVGLKITPSWNQSGQILVRQVDPLPLTVVNLTLEVAIGG